MIRKPKTIPTHPGVYVFKNGKTPLYIGKAANLKKRVSSYFKKNADWKVSELIHETNRLEFIKTDSEIEALIKEAELIKRHTPRFNILMRDDKSYLHIALTKDAFPRFYFTHQPERGETTVGPFVEATPIKQALWHLRAIFPYCTCKQAHRGICVNAQIGRCRGYCCIRDRKATPEEKSEYQKNIRAILSFLSGKRMMLINELKREMKTASKNQEYEKAAKLRDQIYGLETLTQHRGIALKKRGETPYHKVERVLQTLFRTKDRFTRIEGYDISNVSGDQSTGSMVAFYEGKPDKSQYRKFKIRTIIGANDVGSHREVLTRRLHHEEWEYPDLILIDGGKPQLNTLLAVLNRKAFRGIKAAALSKPPRKLFTRAPGGAGHSEDILYVAGRQNPIPVKTLPAHVQYLLQRIRDESHRFARNYHHVLRKKSFALARQHLV